jgi:hypothetical protein
MYHISVRVVERMLRSGELGGVNVSCGKRNRKWRIRQQDVLAFEAARQNGQSPAAPRKRRRGGPEPAGYVKFFDER